MAGAEEGDAGVGSMKATPASDPLDLAKRGALVQAETLLKMRWAELAAGTDSTIAPPKASDFFKERLMAARHEEGWDEQNVSTCFFVCKGLSNDNLWVARGTVFQEIRP